MSAKHCTTRLKSIETLALALVFVFFSGIEFSKAHEHPGYSHDSDTGVEYTDWMSDLPDDMRLSEMSIPGTHDTMAYKVSDSSPCSLPVAKSYTLTQSMDLRTQLDAGIRVLDIRARHIDDAFTMHHDKCYLGSNFDDVLSEARDFLTDHPTETVLMRVKEEHDEENVTRDFEDTFVEYVNDYGNKLFWNPSNSNSPTNPTLGELRGKIVILDNFDGGNYGLDYGSFKIQDEYQVRYNWGLYDKWLDVKDHLNDALNGNPDDIYVNYLSGASEIDVERTREDIVESLMEEWGLEKEEAEEFADSIYAVLIEAFEVAAVLPYFVASGHSSSGTGAPRLSTGMTIGVWGEDKWPDFPRTACAFNPFIGGTDCTISFEGTNILTTRYLIEDLLLSILDAIENGDTEVPPRRVGIIMSDFPGAGLIQWVIAMNGVKLPKNLPPTADAGGPYSADEGLPVTLDASTSTDPDEDTLTYRWDFDGDGNYDTSSSDSPTINRTWNDDQEVTVTVEVSDGEFASTAQASVTVSNVAPSITSTALGSSSIDEGQSVTVSGSFSDPALDSPTETFSGSATWSDGTTTPLTVESGTFSTERTFPDDHPSGTPADAFTVGITLSDDDGGSDTMTSATLTVNNVAPVASIDSVIDPLTGSAIAYLRDGDVEVSGDIDVVLPGSTVEVQGSYTDTGPLDTHVGRIDWGDGSGETGVGLSPNAVQNESGGTTDPVDHAYGSGLAPGARVIELTITDDDSGSGTSTAEIEVVDAAGALAALLDDIQEVIDGDDPNPAAELALYEALHKITGNPSNEVGGDGDGDAENGAMDHLERGNLSPTLVKIRHAIQYLQAAETADTGLDVEAARIQLTLIARSIARGAIDEADGLAGRKGEFRKISRAEALMADGDTHLSGGDFLAAVDDYAAAVRMVENLLNAKPGRSLRPDSRVRAAAIPLLCAHAAACRSDQQRARRRGRRAGSGGGLA